MSKSAATKRVICYACGEGFWVPSSDCRDHWICNRCTTQDIAPSPISREGDEEVYGSKPTRSDLSSSQVLPASDRKRRLRKRPLIFLCHASEDKPRVIPLYKKLVAAGFQPWLDKFDLKPGEMWEPRLRELITNVNNVVLICLSQQSTSKRGVVQKEIEWALQTLACMPDKVVYIIPVRLEECSVPNRLAALQWVDLFEEDGFEQLIRGLDSQICRP